MSQYGEIRNREVQSLGEWREAVVKLDRTSYSEHHHELKISVCIFHSDANVTNEEGGI